MSVHNGFRCWLLSCAVYSNYIGMRNKWINYNAHISIRTVNLQNINYIYYLLIIIMIYILLILIRPVYNIFAPI